MITGELKNKVDSIWDTIWTGGITSPITVLEQVTYLMFMKLLDDNQLKAEAGANALGIQLKKKVFGDGICVISENPHVETEYINNWCEIIINHMVSDSMRAVKMVKKDAARNKYEQTYLTELENLIPYGSDKTAYEKRIEEIIKALRRKTSRQYYIAAFPFFNEKNAIVYDLIHCTSNLKGFQLYKKCVWQTFGGKSSTKNTHGLENQLVLDFEGKGVAKTHTDEFCFYIKDIAEYLQKSFNGQSDVPMSDVWASLDNHPIFPSDGFRPQIKNELKQNHGASVGRSTISFVDRS